MRRPALGAVVRVLAPIGVLIGLLGLWALLARGGGTAPTGHVEHCAPGSARLSLARYDLGARFDGLALADRSELCFPGAPPPAPQTVSVASRIYGTCQPSGFEGGCGPPLEIQSWPLCARRPPGSGAFDHRSWLPALVSRLTARLARLAPDLARQLPTLGRPVPRLPRALTAELARMPVSPEDLSSQIELYTPDTTIVVFADDPGLGRDATAVLAVKAVLHARAAFPHLRLPWPTRVARCATH